MSTKGVYDYDSTQDRLTQIADYSADQLSDIVNVYGAKNLLENALVSETRNNITVTLNDDGTITVNASTASSADTDFAIRNLTYTLFLKAGQYILSGGVSDDCSLYVRKRSVFTILATSKGSDALFTVTSEIESDGLCVYLHCKSGKTFNNVKISPMIRLASIEDDTYVPYAKSNKELTDDKAEKIDLTSINITSGTTNNTGSTIASSTFFYYKGSLVRAKTDIANGATLTENTNYEEVTAGGLNALNSDLYDTIERRDENLSVTSYDGNICYRKVTYPSGVSQSNIKSIECLYCSGAMFLNALAVEDGIQYVFSCVPSSKPTVKIRCLVSRQ